MRTVLRRSSAVMCSCLPTFNLLSRLGKIVLWRSHQRDLRILHPDNSIAKTNDFLPNRHTLLARYTKTVDSVEGAL